MDPMTQALTAGLARQQQGPSAPPADAGADSSDSEVDAKIADIVDQLSSLLGELKKLVKADASISD